MSLDNVAEVLAVAIEHGLRLCSTDGDSARFPRPTRVDPKRET